MEVFYIAVVFFLLGLAIFDLYVGVSSAAVGFMSSAVGSKAAKYKTLLIISAIGIMVGTATSSGMMDIARHGVLQPQYYSFNEVMCVFLAVVSTDVMLVDIFNSLGMPTSTTVSMVFELFGGSTAMAIIKMMHDKTGTLTYASLINTDKVLSIIMAIFLSIAIAFVFGTLLMWISRVVFTFNYKKHMKWSIAIFSGISITSIAYFLLTKGFGQASFMTEGSRQWIADNNSNILIVSLIGSTILMQILHWMHVNVFKIIVLFGTFSLAMAFAGNDLVNFIGVALAGLSSAQDFFAHGAHDPSHFMMASLNEPAKTPLIYLLFSGLVMAVALFISKKARKVINTSVSLSNQNEGDEIFSSSKISRRLVRTTMNTTSMLLRFVPRGVKEWINTRFEKDEDIQNNEVAFDLVRASVTLVLSGLLIVIGTSMQFPLSTTYVAFMVGMGSSLADRAWGRESAVYRITGVISVIGGWFITAGAAFIMCFIITTLILYGGPIAMGLLILLVVFIIIRNNRSYKKKEEAENSDVLFKDIIHEQDKQAVLKLLKQHIRDTQGHVLEFSKTCFYEITDGLINENLKELRHASSSIDEEKSMWKKYRQKEIVGMRKIDYYDAVQKNTWFHLGNNSITQIIYSMKRISDPCTEHVDNNFKPLPKDYIDEFLPIRDEVVEMFEKANEMISNDDYAQCDALLAEGNSMKSRLSQIRHDQQNNFNRKNSNIRLDLLYMNTLQETQELVSTLRHLLRACRKFQE